MYKIFSILIFICMLLFNVQACFAEFNNNDELPPCIVTSHCVLENWEVDDVNEKFSLITDMITSTPRTKITEQTNYFLHAEAQTKWRRYTDDLLVKAFPSQSIIQVRSESRVGIGDNGVNQKRVDQLRNILNKK